MTRNTGKYRTTKVGGEEVRAFVPAPLPPSHPELVLDEKLAELHATATTALARLAVAGMMVPSPDWFLYGFVRKEAVITSQIEGTQATLKDVLTYEATRKARHPDDVQEVCNYVDALAFARREIAKPKGLPLSIRLLCAAHKRLMRGVRSADKQRGEIRTSQNWIGGTRPGNAVFVPPPPDDVPAALSDLERWIHGDDALPPLVRAGLAHAQFETIHPVSRRQRPHRSAADRPAGGALGSAAVATALSEPGFQTASRGILPLPIGRANKRRLGGLDRLFSRMCVRSGR